MMNKRLFATIGCIGVFLFLALIGLLSAGKSAPAVDNRPLAVAAPAAMLAPAKSTPAPVQVRARPIVQPDPRPVPTPSGPMPSGMSGEAVTLSTPILQTTRLLGLLTGGTVILMLGLAIHLGWRRSNGRGPHRDILAEGGHA